MFFYSGHLFAANNTATKNGAWTTAGTWSLGRVPISTDVVVINPGITVTTSTNGALVCASLTIDATGKLTLSSGSLAISGNLDNLGTLTASAATTLTFNGTANSTITGGGSYSIAGTVVMNMGAAATELDVSDNNFITGINTGGKYYFTFTRGTWIFETTATLKDAYNSGSTKALTIPYGVTIENISGTTNLALKGTTGNVLLSGKLLVTGGTVDVQTGQTTNAGQDLNYYVNGGTPQLYMTGGNLNVGAGFNPYTNKDYVDFNMTGGTILVAANGSSAAETFYLQDVTGGKTVMSGGTIILREPCTATLDLDMGGAKVKATQYSVTGGIVQLGDAGTQNSSTWYAVNSQSATNYPHIYMNAAYPKTLSANANGNINMLSLHINSNGTFDASGFPATSITSGDANGSLEDEGAITTSTNTIVFIGTAAQSITSTNSTNVPFYNLIIDNTGGNVTLSTPATVNNLLTLTSGKVDASNAVLTINNGGVAISGPTADKYIITGNGVTQTGNLTIKNLTKNLTTNFPIGTSGSYLPLTVNTGTNTGNSYAASVYQGVTVSSLFPATSLSLLQLSNMVNSTWLITRTAGTGTAGIVLSWASTGTALEGATFKTFGNNIGVTQFDGSSWATATGSGSESSKYATSSFSSFSAFSVIGNTIALPVNLSDFEAKAQGKTALLTWVAYSDAEANNFVVERSTDDGNWTAIGNVAADQVAPGTKSYSFTDPAPADGVNAYRLAIQSEGVTTWSPVKVLDFASVAGLKIYPNPANTSLSIINGTSSKSLLVRLVSSTGQVLQSQTISAAGGSGIELPTGAYPSGIYFIQILSENRTLETQAILIKH